MNPPVIDLKSEHQQLILTILRKHLPSTSKVWVFGSRAKGSDRKYSDIDLVVDMCGEPLSIEILADLATDFEESDLPFKVDIVDWNTINKEFKQLIADQRIALDF